MREILALVLLVILAVAVAGAMGWYMLVGHNWNVTASNIDDSIGQMDGYTVFVYEGTRLPDDQREKLSDAQPLLDDANRGVSELRDVPPASEPVDIKLATSSYRDKGASVFVLDSEDLTAYEEPFVVSKKGLRVGLFSVGTPARPAKALADLKLLRRQHAEFTVGITDDFALCKAIPAGIDLLVCTDDRLSANGAYIDQTFCVGAPFRGEVQAVIMSPSGVLSTKTISRL